MPQKCLSFTLSERKTSGPGFSIIGGKRGGGKTTTLNMVSTATLGTPAPAAAWSTNEEERRKALLSYFLEDDPFVVFDNIKARHNYSLSTYRARPYCGVFLGSGAWRVGTKGCPDYYGLCMDRQ
jgi:hypothetical protein